MTCFEYSPSFRQQSKSYTKNYKAEHVSETLDNAGWIYTNVEDAIRHTLKQQNNGNGIAQRIKSENLDTVLLQKNN